MLDGHLAVLCVCVCVCVYKRLFCIERLVTS